MRRDVVKSGAGAGIMLGLLILTGCTNSNSSGTRTSGADVNATPLPSASATSSRGAAQGELADVALSIDDMPPGATLITPLTCNEGGAAPSPGLFVPSRVCRALFRLSDASAVAYGSYLFDEPNEAHMLAPLLVGGAIGSTKGTRITPPSPEGLDATAIQVVPPDGGAQQFTEMLAFARGRVVLFVSVVSKTDPAQTANDLALAAVRKIQGHFGA